MKNLLKRTLILLFFLAALGLFAQTQGEVKVYIPPITGEGTNEEKAYFQNKLEYEVVLQNHLLLNKRRGSDYTIKGSISILVDFDNTAELSQNPVPDRIRPRIKNTGNRREFFSWEIGSAVLFYDSSGLSTLQTEDIKTGEKILTMELLRKNSNKVISRMYLSYTNIDNSVDRAIPLIIYNLLAEPGVSELPGTGTVLSKTQDASADWRNKWLFTDISFLWAPRIKYTETIPLYWSNFGVGLSLDFQFLNFMALDMGVQFVREPSGGDDYIDYLMEVPVSLKFAIKPSRSLVLGPYGGILYNYSLLKKTEPSAFSYFGGLEFDIKTPLGIFFIDPRFVMDMNNSELNPIVNYRRYIMQVGVGYKIGLVPKK